MKKSTSISENSRVKLFFITILGILTQLLTGDNKKSIVIIAERIAEICNATNNPDQAALLLAGQYTEPEDLNYQGLMINKINKIDTPIVLDFVSFDKWADTHYQVKYKYSSDEYDTYYFKTEEEAQKNDGKDKTKNMDCVYYKEGKYSYEAVLRTSIGRTRTSSCSLEKWRNYQENYHQEEPNLNNH